MPKKPTTQAQDEHALYFVYARDNCIFVRGKSMAVKAALKYNALLVCHVEWANPVLPAGVTRAMSYAMLTPEERNIMNFSSCGLQFEPGFRS